MAPDDERVLVQLAPGVQSKKALLRPQQPSSASVISIGKYGATMRLAREIFAVILYFMAPISLVLIYAYIDSPVVDALGPGVIRATFRLLETAAAFCLMFGFWLLIRNLTKSTD
jgi:hypothetical protein